MLGVTLLLTAAALGLAASFPKTYRAEALLQVDERAVEAALGGGEMRSLAANLDAGGLSSQVDVIRAPNLALQVIASERLLDTPGFRSALQPGWVRRFVTHGAERVAAVAGFEGQIRALLASPAEDSRAAERRRTEAAIKYFEKHLDVGYDQHGSSVRVAYRSTDPELSATVANAVATFYIDQQLRSKLSLLRSAGTWLDQRLKALRAKAEEAESRLVQFRQQHDLGSEHTPSLVREQLLALYPQLARALDQESKAAARLKAAESSKGQDVPEVLRSKVVEDLRTEEAAARKHLLDAELSGDRIRVQRAEDGIKDLDARLRAEADRIVGGLRTDLAAAGAHRRGIEDTITRLTAQARATDQAYSQAAILEREALANRRVFDSVVQKMEEARTLNGLQRPDVELVSPALAPGGAYSPKLGVVAVLGGIVSLVLACAAAGLIEIANPRIRSVAQGETDLGIPALGWIPKEAQLAGAKLARSGPVNGGSALVQDCCRSIMMSVTALAPRQGQVILVTSAAPDDGKTTFALSYARTIAAAGRSCVLVNADLRRPLAGAIRARGEPGLADVIAGRGSLEAALRADRHSGLAILDTGSSLSDPIGVFASDRFPELVGELRRRYDTIIVDAPPLLAVSEGLLLARHVDFTVVVIRWATTPTRAVAAALERLRTAGSDAIAFVLAQVDLRQMRRTEAGRYVIDYARRA